MKYVLLKLENGRAEKFLAKYADKIVLGVWEVLPQCTCGLAWQNDRENWKYDESVGRHRCIYCGGGPNTVTTLAERLRIAFLTNNQVLRYRKRRKK